MKSAGSLSSNDLHVPFHKNTIHLPPRMSESKESALSLMKEEILRQVEKDVNITKRKSNFRKTQKQVRQAKTFLDGNNLSSVPSDKTNKFVITYTESLDNRILNILNDDKTYKKIETSKQRSIENQANKLIRSLVKNTFNGSELQKLISCGSKPANFSVFIKDHKTKEEDGYPLRPIASVRNTAIEKVDWLISNILGQLVQFVPANLKNAEDLINDLNDIDGSCLTESDCFISLDVISLYPSIPIDFGVSAVLEFAKLHWQKINNFNLNIEDLSRGLNFVSYNYEVKFKQDTYRQIRGCPMGAHFAPPFSIIVMHKIETEALTILADKHKIEPRLFKKYIDDVLLGPLPHVEATFETILNVFNSINKDIQFKIEVPKPGKSINFLDVSIIVTNKKIKYSWFTKVDHSGITLRKDSWLPSHVKNNFVKNSVFQIEKRCSDTASSKHALDTFRKRLNQNGYHFTDLPKLSNKLVRKHEGEKIFKTCLTLDFVSDRCINRINKIISKYDFPTQVVSKPAQTLRQKLMHRTNKDKHNNCVLCSSLSPNFKCDDKFVVYKFICKLCKKIYIGQTCRPFYVRFNEHKRSLLLKNKDSALSEHAITDHPKSDVTIIQFDVQIVQQCHSPLETRITEAKNINLLRPEINRKHEKAHL